MTDFDAAVILATVRADPGVPRSVLAATVGMETGRSDAEYRAVLAYIDALEGLGYVQRFGMVRYHLTPAGDERFFQLRAKLQGGMNLINATY